MNFIYELYKVFYESSIYLLLGFFIISILHFSFSQKTILDKIGGKSIKDLLKIILAGIPLPICSCGIIPFAYGLTKKGVPRGNVISFMVATPQIGIDSFVFTAGLLGKVFAIFRIITAFISALVTGIIFNKLKPPQEEIEQENNMLPDETKPKFSLVNFVKYFYYEAFYPLAKPLLVGLTIAALISSFIPDNFFENYLSSDFYSMLLMLVIGIPIYVCAVASTPAALSMVLKGLSPGAALVFLIVGPATNAATIGVVKKMYGKKYLFVYLLVLSIVSVFAGWTLNLLFFDSFKFIKEYSASHSHSSTIKFLGFLIMLIMFSIYFYDIFSNFLKAKRSEIRMENKDLNFKVFKVNGMSCNHCKMTVEETIKSLDFVKDAKVNLQDGTVSILFNSNNPDLNEIKNTLQLKGYEFIIE